jgi:DNA invertase Pin-like site-specific DNA recombinase
MYAIAYYRLSKNVETTQNKIDTQRQCCHRWADDNGIQIYREYSDEGVSGNVPPSKRPHLLEAIRYLADGDMLLVYRRDRLARDLYTVAMIEQLVKERGARVISVAGEGTDSDDPSSIMMRHFADMLAEFERNMISLRSRTALAAKRARNERTGEIPYGKQLAADGVHLEDNPQEISCMQRVRELHSQGLSRRQIRLTMDREHQARGKRWCDQTIVRILRGYGILCPHKEAV